MRSLVVSLWVVAMVLVGRGALATDPAAAREQLKQGFALKEAGRCEEAIAHFVESERLDPQPKTLINLAECQDRMHQLVEAEQNLVSARDMATRPELSTLRAIAVERLAALEPRLPRLTVTLAPGVDGGHVEVLRDGTVLGSVSLRIPLPTNPGKHVVLARAEGRRERSFEVTLAEGEQQEVLVTPGEPVEPPRPALPAGGTTEIPTVRNDAPPPAPPPSSGRRTIALVVGGAGVAAIATGSVFAFVSMYEYSQSNNGCNAANQCFPDALASRQSSLQHGDWATGFVGAGAALVVAGALLWLTAPGQDPPTTGRLGVVSALSPSSGSLGLRGSW
jgi:hypothetical protein